MYIGGMAKKYTISLGDEEADSFSLELFKSSLLQELLKEHYKTHQPNEYVAKIMIDKGYVTDGEPLVSAANVATFVTAARDIDDKRALTSAQKADEAERAETRRRMGL